MKKIDSSELSKNSLSEHVFKVLEEEILNGGFQPGDSLPEMKLSCELGVSRTPVREAISKLELEGLVKTIPNKGSVVVGISQKDIEDIYTIRMYIEGLAARWCAENISEEDLLKLRNVVELEEFYVKQGDIIQAWQLDTRFHEIIYKSSKSHVLNHTLSNFHHYIQKSRELSFEKPGRAKPSVMEHRAILEAIEKHDGDLAGKLTFEHIKNAKENLMQNT